jgi:hypothetical protein
MRFTIGIIAAVGILFSSEAAWAIYKESNVAISEGGKPLPGARVNLTIKSPPTKTTAGTAPPKIVEKKQEKTDHRGVLVFGFDADKMPAGATVDFMVKAADGRTLVKNGVPVTQLAAGGGVNVMPQIGGSSKPAPTTALTPQQQRAVDLEKEGSRILADLQAIRGPCITEAQRRGLSPYVTSPSSWKYSAFYGNTRVPHVPGIRQIADAMDAEMARIEKLPDCPPSGTSISASGSAGQMRRPDFGTALQTETGGVIDNRNFGAVDRTDSFQGFGLKGSTAIDASPFLRMIYGGSYGHASSDAHSSALSTGGNDLNILSPQGPGGGLGGGAQVLAPFSDVTGLRFSDSYDESLFYLGVQLTPWQVPQTGGRVTPYFKALFGYVRETSDYSGTTAAGALHFGYSNELETTRFGVAGGFNAMQPLSGPFGLYADGELRVMENHTSADSTLTLSGAVTASEGAHASANKLDVGGVFGAGIYYITGNVTVRAGASYEIWQVPILKFSENGPVSIDYGARESITATLKATVRFP